MPGVSQTKPPQSNCRIDAATATDFSAQQPPERDTPRRHGDDFQWPQAFGGPVDIPCDAKPFILPSGFRGCPNCRSGPCGWIHQRRPIRRFAGSPIPSHPSLILANPFPPWLASHSVATMFPGSALAGVWSRTRMRSGGGEGVRGRGDCYLREGWRVGSSQVGLGVGR